VTVPSSAHHVGLRVASLAAGVDFYREVFGAVQLSLPKRYDMPDSARIIGSQAAVSFSLCHLRIGEGYIELFEFHEPKVPQNRIDLFAAKLMHLGVLVEDVEETANKIVKHGGWRMMDEPILVSDTVKLLFCYDPDNNALELSSAPQHALIESALTANPQYRP
jgi:predicted enzyme related to lactoylglutathione lyase